MAKGGEGLAEAYQDEEKRNASKRSVAVPVTSSARRERTGRSQPSDASTQMGIFPRGLTMAIIASRKFRMNAISIDRVSQRVTAAVVVELVDLLLAIAFVSKQSAALHRIDELLGLEL